MGVGSAGALTGSSTSLIHRLYLLVLTSIHSIQERESSTVEKRGRVELANSLNFKLVCTLPLCICLFHSSDIPL